MRTISRLIFGIFLIILAVGLAYPTCASAIVDSGRYREVFFPDGMPERTMHIASGNIKEQTKYRCLAEYAITGTDDIFVVYEEYMPLGGNGTSSDLKAHWVYSGLVEKNGGNIILKNNQLFIKEWSGGYRCYDVRAYITGYDAFKDTKGIFVCLYFKENEDKEHADVYVFLVGEKESLEPNTRFRHAFKRSNNMEVSRLDFYLAVPGENGRAEIINRKFEGNMKQRDYSVFGFYEEGEPCLLFNFSSQLPDSDEPEECYGRGYFLLKRNTLPENAKKVSLPRSFEEAGK